MIRRDLQDAIETGAIRATYQPIVRVADGRVLGAEALARWTHPELGAVGPDEFIPVAESIGAIQALGLAVLQTASAQAADWQRNHPGRDLFVAVNVSPTQLTDDTFIPSTLEALDASGLDPTMLCLEVTEGTALPDWKRPSRLLDDLRAVGVRVAVDDFGTGHNSLARLKQVHFDTLKIDRSFIAGIGRRPRDEHVIRGSLAVADAFDLDVVAEGVERFDQVQFLVDHGCPVAQGYLWSAAVDSIAFAALLLRPSPRVDQLAGGSTAGSS